MMTPSPSPHHHHEGEEDGADCLADELPHEGYRCTLLQRPTTAQAQLAEPSRYSLHARLHSTSLAREPTCGHNYSEQPSTFELQASLGLVSV
jgi:hypothetical protein